MRYPQTIAGLCLMVESMGMLATQAQKPDPPKEPEDDLCLSDVCDKDSEWTQRRASDHVDMWEIAQKVGGDRLKKAIDSACELAGCMGTEIEDLTAAQHQELSRICEIEADLSTDAPSASMYRLLHRMHHQAYYLLHDLEDTRSRAERVQQSPTESQLDSPEARANAERALKNMPPGRRRAFRALLKAKDKNKDRIKDGKRPVIKGKEVDDKKFRQVTGVDPRSMRDAQVALDILTDVVAQLGVEET